MGMNVITHNIMAMNAQRMNQIAVVDQKKNTEKLSSGYRVNRSADDAAGLAISEKMRRQIRGLTQATANAQDGISMLQTAEGAMNEVHDMLQRMNELVIKAENGTLTEEDRGYIAMEVDQLTKEIDRVASTTSFNEKNLLLGDDKNYQSYTDAIKSVLGVDEADIIRNGNTFTVNNMPSMTVEQQKQAREEILAIIGGDQAPNWNLDKVFWQMGNDQYVVNWNTKDGDSIVSLQVGAESGQHIDVTLPNLSAASLGLVRLSNAVENGGKDPKVQEIGLEIDAIDIVKQAMQIVSKKRSDLGAQQNRLEHTINNLDNVVENTTDAESAIRDTDMAKTMVTYSNQNILIQAGHAMLAQANQSKQGILSILG